MVDLNNLHFKIVTMTVVTFILIVIGVTGALSLQLIPERAYVKYINDKYAGGTKFYVKRYSRKGQYYINLEGSIKQEWGNNVSTHFYFYEFLHNEYKRSFVELHYANICDWIDKDPYIGAAIKNNPCFDVETKRKLGLPFKADCADNGTLKCPFPAGFYKLNNVSVPTAEFPNVWPFERFRVDCSARTAPGDELMFELQIYASVKQNIGK